MGKINKNAESKYFSELDSFGNKQTDMYGVAHHRHAWPAPESLRKISEKDTIV